MDYKQIIKSKNIRKKVLNCLWFVPDKMMVSILYRIKFGRKLNLQSPRYYSEKLQWIKLYDRKAIYTKMVDKYQMKSFLAEIIGEEYAVPTLGIWDSFDDIDFDLLPNQFVLKCTHDSGSVTICHNKKEMDYKKTKAKFDSALKNNAYLLGREWPYKNADRKIIAEPFLEDLASDEDALIDYKFFCFNGEPKIMYISNDTGAEPHTDFFDMEFNHLPIRMKDPNSKKEVKKPQCFNEMIEISKALSKGIRHLRVDFYYVNNKLYVGEMTFFHGSGFVPISPSEWDLKMGEWISI